MDGCHTHHFPPTGNSWAGHWQLWRSQCLMLTFSFWIYFSRVIFLSRCTLSWPETTQNEPEFMGTLFSPLIMKWYMDDIKHLNDNTGGFPMAQQVNNLPAMQEIQVWSLDQEDPLEEEMATHSSILAGKIPWTEERIGLQSMGLQSQTWLKRFSMHTHITTLTKHKHYKEKTVKSFLKWPLLTFSKHTLHHFSMCVCVKLLQSIWNFLTSWVTGFMVFLYMMSKIALYWTKDEHLGEFFSFLPCKIHFLQIYVFVINLFHLNAQK